MANLGYDISAAYYLDVANALDDGKVDYHTFKWVVVETKPPYLSVVYTAAYRSLTRGTEQYVKAIDLYLTCVRDGRWPGYAEGEIDLPEWVFKEDIR